MLKEKELIFTANVQGNKTPGHSTGGLLMILDETYSAPPYCTATTA